LLQDVREVSAYQIAPFVQAECIAVQCAVSTHERPLAGFLDIDVRNLCLRGGCGENFLVNSLDFVGCYDPAVEDAGLIDATLFVIRL
jgi:hypothetical protein